MTELRVPTYSSHLVRPEFPTEFPLKLDEYLVGSYDDNVYPFVVDPVMDALCHTFPGLGIKIECPACPNDYHPPPYYRLCSMITHLNDEHEMPREQIADWLETLDIDLSFPSTEEVSS